MKRLNKIYQLTLASVLLLCLLAPLIIYLFTPARTISLAEKRQLVAAPEFTLDYERLVSFPEKFNQYYQDHFGLRDTLITFYNKIKLNIFGVSPSPLVVKGLDGWYFYMGADSIAADFYGMDLVDVQKLEDYTQVIADRRDWLGSMGIRYLFVPVPNKNSVYPEQLPRRIRHAAGRTFYQQWLDYLHKANVDDVVVDVYALLNRNKDKHQVYLMTDTHWNHLGALDTFNLIVSKLMKWFPDLQRIDERETTQDTVTHVGDLAYIMHLEDVVSEEATVISQNAPCSRDSDHAKLAESLYEKLPATISAEDRPKANGCKGEKLTALVIHDSFGDFMYPFFNQRFNTVVYSNRLNLNQLQDFIVALRPDMVIDQRVARSLKNALVHDRELEEKAIKIQLDQAGKATLNISADNIDEYTFTTHAIEASAEDNGILMQAVSRDPHITIPFTRKTQGKRYNAMIELTVPDDTFMQVFFTPAGVQSFNQQDSMIYKMNKGYNRLYFRFPNKDIGGDIRLDPGAVEGQYILHSLVIKERHLTATAF